MSTCSTSFSRTAARTSPRSSGSPAGLKPYLDRAPRSRVAAWACEKLRGVVDSIQRPPTTRSSSTVPVREPWAVAMT